MFNVGDLVYILPYEEVENHYGIGEETWNRITKRNPHIISQAHKIYFEIEDDVYQFNWPNQCASTQPYKIEVPDIMEMV